MNSGTNRNLIRSLGDQIKLISRLIQDKRISPFLKLLPFGSLVYFISPFDFPTPIDDAGVIWFFVYLFVELCPAEIVQEHQVAIQKEYLDKQRAQGFDVEIPEGEIVDAEFVGKEEQD